MGGGPELLQEAWSYGYQVNADRLLHLSPVGDPGLAHRYYGYNATGDLLTDSYRLRTSTTIGRGHLPWTFTQTNEEEDLLRGTYLYDVRDQRIYKRYEGPGRIKVGKVLASSWHLRDAGGREVGVLDLETGRWAWYLFGAQRFARVQPNNGSQQPAFYSGDLGELGGLSQEGDEYQDLLDLLLELAGADEELDYPLTVHRVVLTGGAVLFLSDTAWSALQGQGTPVDDEEPWTFNSGTNEVTVAHAGGSVTLSIEALLGEGAHGGAPNANGFWYIYPADTTLHSVTYYEHDHLGNLRVAHTPMLSCTEDAPPVMDVAGSSYTLEHVLDYYPYGKVLKEYVNSGGPERYLTTQHERDQETGLDYRGARYYDADVARFLSLDPLAADYVSWSAYNYVMGNPISLVDLTGRSATKYVDENGGVLANTNDGNNATVTIGNDNVEAFKGELSQFAVDQNSPSNNADWIRKYGERMTVENGGMAAPWAAQALGYDANVLPPAVIGLVGTALEENVSQILLNRARYDFKGAPYEPVKFPTRNVTVRTPFGGLEMPKSTLGKIGTGLKVGGYGLGIYQAYDLQQQYSQGLISGPKYFLEQGSNAFSTFGGVYGAAWSVGWEGGRYLMSRPAVRDWMDNTWYPWREKNWGY